MQVEIDHSCTIAIVAARAGSKSLKDKNIAPLKGFPLIAYSIAAAKMAQGVDRILFSSDSEEYCEIAQHYGAEVPFVRPQEFATDTSTDRDYILHAMKWLNQHEGAVPNFWVHLRPTTPLRDPALIDEAIAAFREDEEATSLRSGHKFPETPLKWFRREGRFFKGLLEVSPEDEYYNLPKESFPPVYIPDGYVDLVSASHVFSHETLHGDNILSFISPVSTEVDSPEEFEYLEYQIDRNGSVVLDYLTANYSKGA